MNEKEASEILSGSPIGRTEDYCKSDGYLERVKQEKEIFGPIVKLLEDYVYWDKTPDWLMLQEREEFVTPDLRVEGVLAAFYKDNPSWK